MKNKQSLAVGNGKKVTLTVGIPAYNEAANIGNLVNNLLEQKETNYILKKVLVVSDGSTDNTVGILSSIRNKKLEVVDRKKRLGGGKTKDEIIKKTNSDALVLLDADVLPISTNFLNEITKPIVEGYDLVGANTIPVPAKSFFEKMVANSHMFKKHVYKLVNNANNVYLCHGRGRAFSKKLYQRIVLPDSTSEDAYSYLFAKQNGYKFKFAEPAKLWYRASSAITDREIQSKRFLSGKETLLKYFEKKYVSDSFKIPKKTLLVGFIAYLFKAPLLTISYVFWIAYVILTNKAGIKETGKWKMSPTSKKLT